MLGPRSVVRLGALALVTALAGPAFGGDPDPVPPPPLGDGFERYMQRLDALDALEKGLDKKQILERFGADSLEQTFGEKSFDALFGEAPPAPVGPAIDDKARERLGALEAQRAAEVEARRVAAVHRGVNCWKSSWMLAVDLQESSLERGYALGNLADQARFDALASVWLDDDFRDGYDTARDWLTGLGSLATGVGGVLVAGGDSGARTGGWLVGLGSLGVLVGQGLDALFGTSEADLVKRKLAVLDLTRNAFDALRARLDDFDAVRASFASTLAALDLARRRFPDGKPDFLPREVGLTDPEREAMVALLDVVPSYRDAVGRYLDLSAAQRQTARRVVASARGLALPQSFADVIAKLEVDLASPDFDRDTQKLRGMHDRAIELVSRCVPDEQAAGRSARARARTGEWALFSMGPRLKPD